MDFSLFGRLNLRFDTGGHRGYERYFNNEYKRISNNAALGANAPTITVKIVKQLPLAATGDIERSVHCKKLLTFNFLIREIHSDAVCIYFKTHFLDKFYMNAVAVFLQAQVLEPIIYLKLLQQNVLFMHAGGVCDERNGYLFPAFGGTGKTTFSIALLNYGYKLLGDDLLIVDISEKKVYPYPRPLHLFTYNINNLHGARVPLKYQAAIYAKNILRFLLERVLSTEFLISTRVHADELFDQNPFGGAVPYAGIYFLVKDGLPTSAKEVNASSLPELAGEIMASADLNDSLYALLADEDDIHSVRRLEENVIQRFLEQFSVLTYVNTRKLDLSDLSWFVENEMKAATISDL